jgi:hypothetical protein
MDASTSYFRTRWEKTSLTIYVNYRGYDDSLTTSKVMVELSYISKKVRMLLKSKCQWDNPRYAWGFIKGSIIDAIATHAWY